MRITVLGATGGTGREVVRQAVEAGHDVTAVVRGRGRIDDERVREVVADVADPEALVGALRGADAVIGALGSREKGPTTVCRDGARAAQQAMPSAKVSRLVLVSASGLHDDEGDDLLMRWVVKPIVRTVFRHQYADMAVAEEIVRSGELDWTILLPPQLTDGPRTGTYRTARDRAVPKGHRVSRADVADCALRCLDDPSTVRSLVALAD